MKFSLILSVALLARLNAFSPVSQSRQQVVTTTSLNLFGGNKEGGDEKKGPGMMDQIAMFKKAQEIATKKKKLDEELQKEDFTGAAPDDTVTAHLKFVPVSNPMDPNPDYEATRFDFDDAFYDSATAEELSSAITEALKDAYQKTNLKVAETYQSLQTDLMDVMGQKKE